MDPRSCTGSNISSSSSSSEIAIDMSPFVIVYKDGRIERPMGTPNVPPSTDPTTGVVCKDVIIAATVSARLYLPKTQSGETLPVLVYYHGGGFCIESPFSSLYQGYITSLVTKANVIAVSVDYRLAPENPLPAAYDDAWTALQFVIAKKDQWISDYGDMEKLFIAGDSAGGNIVHNIAMRAGKEGLTPKFRGAALVHPYFWGPERLQSEMPRDPKSSEEEGRPMLDVALVDSMWAFVCPSSTGFDDPRVNPWTENAPSLKGVYAERVLIFVAAKDVLRDRGREYFERLKGSGWTGSAEIMETEGEDHVFHLFNPKCAKALAKVERLAAFLRS